MRYRTPLRLIGGLSAFLLFWVAVDATSRTGDTSRLDAMRFDPNRRAAIAALDDAGLLSISDKASDEDPEEGNRSVISSDDIGISLTTRVIDLLDCALRGKSDVSFEDRIRALLAVSIMIAESHARPAWRQRLKLVFANTAYMTGIELDLSLGPAQIKQIYGTFVIGH
jgi:hypothetical protein